MAKISLMPRHTLTRSRHGAWWKIAIRFYHRLPGAVVFLVAASLHAQLINVDFNNNSYGAGNGGPNPGPTMSGAAVFGAAGDYWNGISTNNSYAYGGITFKYANGSASPVTMSFTSSGGYDAKSFNGSTPFANTAYNNLMEEYLFTYGGTNQSIILDGLATNAAYDVVLYNAGDSAAINRRTFFIINDSFQSSTWNGVTSNLIAGIDYVEFSSVFSDGLGRLIINYTGDGNAEGDVNGFQIRPAAGQIPALTNNAAYTWTTFAGNSGVGGADGIGSQAQFFIPGSLATDGSNNVYVTDSYNHTIRKITPEGVVSTIAGAAGYLGAVDGIGAAARFDGPNGITADNAGNLYVCDTGNDLIRKLTPSGTNWIVSTIAGAGAVPRTYNAPITNYLDGLGTNTYFYQPQGIAADANGNLYVVDNYNCVIRKITPVGGTNWLVKTIAGNPPTAYGLNNGRVDGTNGTAKFNYPVGIVIDKNGNLFIGDSGNNAIREIKPVGTNWVVTTIAGGSYGHADGTNSAAQFNYPSGMTVDSGGNLFVADADNDTVRKITPTGGNWVVTTFAGQALSEGNTDGTGGTARFNHPNGIAIDVAGNFYVADLQNNIIRKITSAAVVKTFAGSAFQAGDVDGTGSDARFTGPFGIAIDHAGDLYVADSVGNTIRQISSAGVVTTMAGLSGTSGSADGAGSNARFSDPRGIAVDNSGNVFVTDYTNNTVREITPAGVVTTIAGLAGLAGTNNGTGSAARFYQPMGIAVDANDNLYVCDNYYNTIRKITLNGNSWVVTTIAGVANLFGGTDNGENNGALFDEPMGITVDANGDLYVTDGNSRIRKMTLVGTNWIVTTIADDVFQFKSPFGIAVDSANNLYVADTGNFTVRKLSMVGSHWTATTIGGLTGVVGSSDGAGNQARFSETEGIAVDNSGDLFIADLANGTIRKGVFTAYGPANTTPYAPQPMTGSLKVTLLPAQANGQWRFPWEISWHNSGQTVSNLVAGNYSIEFRSVPGWVAVPQNLTDANSAGVTNGGTSFITNYYYPTLSTVDANSGSTLTITLGPNPPPGAGWRFLGDTTPFYPSGYSTNLVAGIYLIEFAAVSGRSRPPNLSVQIQAGEPTLISENYLLVSGAPSQVLLPFPVPSTEISDVADYPFGFNGWLQSDVGYGSGVAVQTNVVLTAAHVIFNDQALSYVNQAYWYFQQETGVYSPLPLAARGWYVLSGYASQRTNDLEIYTPETSTPQSRDLDVAALYFLEQVAGGGYGGYLPSDESPNPWLTGNSLKMLAGYPVDGSEFGNASIVPGEMYQTDPQPYSLSLASDPVINQQVYLASWFLSYAGNSGGPFYVQYNGYYYPAGIYLGTLYNGVTPYASVVRAIDGDVVNLITNAAALGDTGTNHTGGGVITIIPNQAISASNPGYLQFLLGPPAAVAAGAGWRLQGDSTYSSATNYVRAVTSTNAFAVEFKPINGWNVPTNQFVTVSSGTIATYNALYTVAVTAPVLMANTTGISIMGATGTTYRIESRASLTAGSWISIRTNTIAAGGFNLILPKPTNAAIFYRAVVLP